MPKVTDDRFGHESYENNVRKFCRLENGVAGTWNFCWEEGNGYNGILDTEDDIEIYCESVNDTDGGSHAFEVIITGQGNDGIMKSYSIPTGGQSWVKLSTLDSGVKFKEIYRAKAKSNTKTPVDGSNEGKIIIRSVTNQYTMAVITAGSGQTQMGFFRVPANKFGLFKKYVVSPDANRPFQLDFRLQDTPEESWRTSGTLDFGESLSIDVDYPIDLYFGPGAAIFVAIKPEQSSTTATVQFFIELRDIPNYDKLLEEGEI